jgi:endonuclease/exonuclease/phosphatase family protein
LVLSVLLLLNGGVVAAQVQAEPRVIVRVASFNVSLNRQSAGQLAAELAGTDNNLKEDDSDRQVQAVAEIIQRIRPDVILLNEFDFDAEGLALKRFQQNFLGVSQNQQQPVVYPYTFQAPSNTGTDTGLDLDGDGKLGGPGDAFGFGAFPGQYGMAVLSKYPIISNRIRTFQNFLWRDMPGALLPDNPETPEAADFYTPEQLEVFRLSSKSHWDVPIQTGSGTLHVLAAHPTPPVFDGPEDRNGARNHDEIRLWADYVGPQKAAEYITDDDGHTGGLGLQRFVVLGDYNADPVDGDSRLRAIDQLLDHPAINASWIPVSDGAAEDAKIEGMANATHIGAARFDTADLNPNGPGNLRIDYVLPSRFGLTPLNGGVFWPAQQDPLRYLVGDGFPVVSSDHRLVWLDLQIQPATQIKP